MPKNNVPDFGTHTKWRKFLCLIKENVYLVMYLS